MPGDDAGGGPGRASRHAQRAREAPRLTSLVTALKAPRVFSIPAHAPFLPTLAAALLEGALAPKFPDPADPLALSRATVYLPTRRAASAFRTALLQLKGEGVVALPRIAALGAFESAEGAVLPEDGGDFGPPDAVGELQRRMALAALIRRWAAALKEAKTDGGAPLIGSSPAQVFALAGDLGELIDEMTIEGVDWRALDKLVPDAFDHYWSLTLRFLRIAAEHWPEWLSERGLIDRVARGARLIEAEIARLDAPGAGPTIVAGSTGTNRATARLMAAVARAPQGAVVLPDFDDALDDASVAQILAGGEAAASAAGHPQAALLRLLAAMDVRRDQVLPIELGLQAAPRTRARLLSEAMRPSETTDFWRRRRETLSDEATEDALVDVAYVVAQNEVEESLAIAVAMRETLETPDKTAALVTPDAGLSRRVAADLKRFGVAVENASGAVLSHAPIAVFARLALAAAISRAPGDCAALIGHALFCAPSAPAFDGARRVLDLAVLRRPEATVKDALDAQELERARGASLAERRRPWIARLSEEDWRAAAALAAHLRQAFDLLAGFVRSGPLKEILAAHRTLVWTLAGLNDEHAIDGQQALGALFASWGEAIETGFDCSLNDYIRLFDEALAKLRWSPETDTHPRLAILGLLEARLLSFDRVVLGGLDEMTWPPAPRADAFLNRAMRADLGLSSPERRIGQTAHDFVAALGAKEVLLTRALKRDRKPTLPSRFVLRLQAVAGAAMGQAQSRGDRYLDLARALDRPERPAFIKAPEPRPPRALRPTKLSVTAVETLRRDPYAIFAGQILRLAPLDPIGTAPGPREIGMAWHAVLQRYVEARAGRAEDLLELLRVAFAPFSPEHAFAVLKWPELQRAAAFFLEQDAAWRAELGRYPARARWRAEVHDAPWAGLHA